MILNANLDPKAFNPERLGKKKTPKQVETLHLSTDVDPKDVDLLWKCSEWYASLADFRYRRARSRRYLRGDQWHEAVVSPTTGQTITEEQLIKDQGKIPFKQNLIRQMEKNIVGQFRLNPLKSVIVARNREDAKVSEMITMALECTHDLNKTKELDVRNFEEAVLSGSACCKTTYRYWPEKNREDLFQENVNVNRIFFNTDVSDIRLFDLNLIGELIDVPLDEVVAVFAKNRAHEDQIRDWYKMANTGAIDLNGLSSSKIDLIDFQMTYDNNKVRLYEIWQKLNEWRLYVHDPMDASYQIVDMDRKDDLELINAERLRMAQENMIEDPESYLLDFEERCEPTWSYKYLTPDGHCLYQAETPYVHEEHPYTLMLYPLLDGEVWGMIEDVIDQQRYINRLISLLDFIMGSSAKGVLLVPEDAIHDDFDLDAIAEQWSKFNGVIKLKLKPGAVVPQQISANSTNIGAHELLAIQMKMMEEIFGVNSAIQGQKASSGTPSSLYAQEAQNATINSKDIMDFFAWFIERRDNKTVRLITQYYQQDRFLNISGKSYDYEAKIYKPSQVEGVDIDLKVVRGTDTPVYRQLIDDLLFKLLDGNFIDVEMFLENTSLPFADHILETIAKRRQQMQAGQVPNAALDPNVMAQMAAQPGGQASGISPQAQALMNTMMANSNAA
jgi:hypothetical protein